MKELEAEQEQEAKESRVTEENDNRRRIVAAPSNEPLPEDVLIVVSKLKAYVKARGGMNTSDTVTDDSLATCALSAIGLLPTPLPTTARQSWTATSRPSSRDSLVTYGARHKQLALPEHT